MTRYVHRDDERPTATANAIVGEWEAAVSAKNQAKTDYQNATTDSERIAALAAYTLAQDDQLTAIRKYVQVELME